jgi:hypothetical protein
MRGTWMEKKVEIFAINITLQNLPRNCIISGLWVEIPQQRMADRGSIAAQSLSNLL